MFSSQARSRSVAVARRSALAIVACAWLAPAAGAQTKAAQGAAEKGKLTYARYCVSCHGPGARGDGPLAKDLRVAVPDLTTIAARNSGQYPAERIQRIIENGEPVRGHGTPDMPAWGDAFKKTAGIEATSPREAILNLTEYLRSLQPKDSK